MDFKELKNKREKELKEAIEKQGELVALLQKDFDDLDKFKKGHIIDNDSTYYIIVGEPELLSNSIRLPVRHHVYATYGCGNTFKLNMSGVIDYVDICLDKIPDVSIITPKEIFERAKDKLKEEFRNFGKRYERDIFSYKNKIEEYRKRIEECEKKIKEYNSIDIDKEFDNFVNNYLEKSFEQVAFTGIIGYEKYGRLCCKIK